MTPPEEIRLAGNELTRRERRKLEVRNRILEAAISLFEEAGIEATKVAEICERADVAHKTFFNHFPSRQHLLQEIAGYALDQLLTNIEEARKQPASTGDRILHFFSHLADNVEEAGPMHRELFGVIVRVAHDSGNEPEQARKLHDAFGAIIRDGRSAGDVTCRHSCETLAEMLLGAFYALMFNWANLDGYPLREQAVATAKFLADSMSISKEE